MTRFDIGDRVMHVQRPGRFIGTISRVYPREDGPASYTIDWDHLSDPLATPNRAIFEDSELVPFSPLTLLAKCADEEEQG
jgi:hypothetical protein